MKGAAMDEISREWIEAALADLVKQRRVQKWFDITGHRGNPAEIPISSRWDGAPRGGDKSRRTPCARMLSTSSAYVASNGKPSQLSCVAQGNSPFNEGSDVLVGGKRICRLTDVTYLSNIGIIQPTAILPAPTVPKEGEGAGAQSKPRWGPHGRFRSPPWTDAPAPSPSRSRRI